MWILYTCLTSWRESLEFTEEEEEEDTLQPQKGNVAFVCDLDGWGFGIREFSEFYATKLGASSAALQKALRGPRFFNPRDRDECGVEVHGCKKQGASYVCAGAPMARFKDIFNII